MRLRRKYKLYNGVQQIEIDSPDYNEALREKAKRNASDQNLNNAIDTLSGGYKPISQVTDIAGDLVQSTSNNKKSGATWGGAIRGAGRGAALGASIGGPIGAGVGALAFGAYNAWKGAKDYDKTKELAQDAERKADASNYAKRFSEGTSTDVQQFVAKKGKNKLKGKYKSKYKVKTKQPRMIETEGREPIFSPPDKNGKRKLLYYNPNDPTHEEGGVKAMVIPKAQGGKQATKSQPVKPEYLEDKDSWGENIGEIFDPTGLSSWDDAGRSFVNLKNDPKNPERYIEAGLETLGAVPAIGKLKYLIKAARAAKKLKKTTKWGDFIGDINSIGSMFFGTPLSDEGYNQKEQTYKGRKILPQFYTPETVGMGAPAFQAGTSKIMSGRKHYEIPEIKPPTPYELMPKPPRSRFNKDSKKVKVYR